MAYRERAEVEELVEVKRRRPRWGTWISLAMFLLPIVGAVAALNIGATSAGWFETEGYGWIFTVSALAGNVVVSAVISMAGFSRLGDRLKEAEKATDLDPWWRWDDE